MKIYHKKNFAFGLFALFLGALNLVRGALQGFDWHDGALGGPLLLLGGAGVVRGLSPKWSREGRVEEWDERNRLGRVKSRRQG